MIIARKTLIVNNCLSSVDFVGCEARILRSVLLLALCDRRTIDSNRAEYCDSHLIGKKVASLFLSNRVSPFES
ncbi:predicted protein [Ostreococcus lucimarinus CCE9901]|jgi:hypothetical protein|uniref:Uncharacterized protein n=1 Tax=Ostreococcus lucimarinus (strain CCE9901) TaxID=436017 RepID=A4RSQ0_OSTLU|nr:predicted protein [Ostreococcus lucimarinus CCE9901]ABO94744.1 predicted protein [Ostreococcus lucimarinus CCE9901]|eukprot:XP_001416451.1 predicted protein [Ostreococcus lucimarinus CCE9901]